MERLGASVAPRLDIALLLLTSLVPIVPRSDLCAMLVLPGRGHLTAGVKVTPVSVFQPVEVVPLRHDRAALGIFHEEPMTYPLRPIR